MDYVSEAYPKHQGGRESQQQQTALPDLPRGWWVQFVAPYDSRPLPPKSSTPAPPTDESAWRQQCNCSVGQLSNWPTEQLDHGAVGE
jgi:hypothetical protein